MRLASTGLFRARWSAAIQDEWSSSLLRERPELGSKLARTIELMERAIPDASVTGFEPLIGGLSLPDANDRHVLAAAIAGRADVIVTRNTRHFPPGELAAFGIEAQDPDAFIRHVLDLDPPIALEAVKLHRAALRTPSLSVKDYLASLARNGLVETVTYLRDWNALI